MGSGSDKVYLTTDLPSGIYPFRDGQQFCADIAHGDGTDWVRKNLGIEPEVVRTRS